MPAVRPAGPRQPTRVGIVSGQISNHPGWLMIIRGWLTQLDRRRFELFSYVLKPRQTSEMDFARAHFDRLVEGKRSLEEWCALIREDSPHVLIYDMIGDDPLRNSLAALRLAPVQCAAWGSPVTTGIPNMDYFLSSELMEPPGARAHYTEELVLLPNLSNYLQPREFSLEPGTRAEFGLRDDAVVYLCDQTLIKYLPEHDVIFAQIAAQVENCQFVFSRGIFAPKVTTRFQRRLELAFAARGLDAGQYVVWRNLLPSDRYHLLCGLCDVSLDSIGYSGCTTTIEAALPHNLPVVTMASEFARGRQSLAIMRRIGVTETTAAGPVEFVAIATRLGRDQDYRREISARIAANKHRVYGDRECIAGLETFLQRAVHEALAARPAQTSPARV